MVIAFTSELFVFISSSTQERSGKDTVKKARKKPLNA